jgi:hypothetical protein
MRSMVDGEGLMAEGGAWEPPPSIFFINHAPSTLNHIFSYGFVR